MLGKSYKAEKTFRLVYMQEFRSVWLPSEKGKEEKLLAAERSVAVRYVSC